MASGSQLLRRFALHRDEAAFRRLYRHHTPRLYGLAVRLSGAPADAEELVQEAWVRAIERLDRFQRRSGFHTWLCGILVNCYREQRRRLARAPVALGEPDEARGGGARTALPEPRPGDRIDVERAIAGLPDGYREVLVLHDLHGHTHLEIAGLLEIREGTSKSQLARARARLRETLRGGPRPAEGYGGKKENRP